MFITVATFPILIVACYFIVFFNSEIDKDIWASILTCVISYVGTIGWGIFIFHDSWLRNKEEERKNRPRLSMDYHYDCLIKNNGVGHQLLFSYERLEKELKGKINEYKVFDDNDGLMNETKYDYLGIIFRNHGSHLIYAINIEAIYIASHDKHLKAGNNRIVKQKGKIFFSLKDNPSTLAFNDTAMYFIGIERELADTKESITRNICILLSIEDEFGKEHYYLLHIYYNNGSIMYSPQKEINDKEINKIYKNPNLLLDYYIN